MGRPSKRIRDLINKEAEAAEAGEADQDSPIPPHVTITRGNPRSKVLQVRLNPDELEALERIADQRELPVSTIAREQLLKLISEDNDGASDHLQQLIAASTRVTALATGLREDLRDRLRAKTTIIFDSE